MAGKGKARDGFISKWGFILACIGSAVGMGNIWMFPQRVSRYGGGTFLIPYLIFVFLIASSGVTGEMAFGRGTRSGPMGAFKKAVESRGWSGRLGETLGIVPVLGSLALAIGYTVVVGWIFKYTFGAFSGATLAPASPEAFVALFGGMAVAFGNNLWQWIAIAVTFFILIMGIGNGIERANGIMMPLFFLLFICLGVYVFFQEGAADGYKYIFTIDPNGLRDPMTWIYAIGQSFFSLSVAGNGTLIYGSYLSDKEDVLYSARNVAVFDTIASMLAALVIIPAIATTGAQLNTGGPGLMFIALPNLFKNMPCGVLIVIIFFVAVTFAGISSLINLYETPIATLQERLGFSRLQACLCVAGAGLVVSTCIQGIVGGWMDFVSIYVCPLGAGMAGIMFFWVFGKRYVAGELMKGRSKPLPVWIYPLSKYIYCALTVIVLLLGIVTPGGIG
ncbi:MAG: sodium-dependent transporter [Synergistaceae bacterium]|nr:sodium-dependent transporter [Synergistaceae bacterium]